MKHPALVSGRCFARLACAALLVGGISPANAGADVVSGPELGVQTPALPVFAVTGESADRQVDYSELRGKKPTVYAFVSQARWDRPMARLLRDLDQNLREQARDAELVVVWLPDDVAAAKAYLPKAQMSLRLSDSVLSVYEGGIAGPDGWAINDRADLTIVVTGQGLVAARFGFVSVNETLAADVLTALKKAGESN